MDTDTDSTSSPICHLKDGDMAIIVSGGMILPTGEFVPPDYPCVIEPGGGWRLYYDEVGESPVDPVEEESKVEPDATSPEPVVPDPSLAPPAPPPAEPVHPVEPVHVAPAVAAPSDSADLSQALGVGDMLKDNPWAPLVIVVLALVAVLGGRQGWKFYSERSAQRHELEMKKLELQANPTVQPPPCAAKQLETDAKIAALEAKLSSLEKKNSAFGDFNPEDVQELVQDLEKRLKKLEKAPKPKPSA